MGGGGEEGLQKKFTANCLNPIQKAMTVTSRKEKCLPVGTPSKTRRLTRGHAEATVFNNTLHQGKKQGEIRSYHTH